MNTKIIGLFVSRFVLFYYYFSFFSASFLVCLGFSFVVFVWVLFPFSARFSYISRFGQLIQGLTGSQSSGGCLFFTVSDSPLFCLYVVI